MNDHHPRLQNLRSTSQLLREASSSFSSNLITFLFLSLLILSFRTLVENGTYQVTSFIDRDPSLKTLLSRIDLAGASNNHRRSDISVHRRRRPFLHLTRVGTLYDDFFSGDEDGRRSLFGSNLIQQVNGSFVAFGPFNHDSGFSDLVIDDGIRVSEIVRSGIMFKENNALSFAEEDEDIENNTDDEEKRENIDDDFGKKEEKEKEKNGDLGSGQRDMEKSVDFQFLGKGIEMGRRDAAALFFLVSFLSAAYGWVILVFLVTYSWVLGVVFVAVVNDIVGRFSSVTGLVLDGSRLGLKRLSGFILMKWAVRDALTQLIGLWYFGEIEDQYLFFKLFVSLKLMPFSVMSLWVREFEKESSGFLFTWALVDTFVAFLFSVDAWVAIVDSRRSGMEIVKEGCYLISTMFNQAMQIKCLEGVGMQIYRVNGLGCGNWRG
ncbi:PREDICTED: uncharacterized protein LOC109333596 isoform X2 [Lupinus angustifolius]|uniref:uncharacterized protein LOC109333596 isoform X2 n=1 Tax=Lupinus angustifolius TaxID=3871 RepID=UPI00092FBBB7|nr:PREDICTED: uncharacterized protein LOC109333596 isoform X2 [Lupinus angustifolius]XP_019424652.1 PREDICTED: uncharacterized protein LOC109333596 isoform X2 [Lupinus angustifolius]